MEGNKDVYSTAPWQYEYEYRFSSLRSLSRSIEVPTGRNLANNIPPRKKKYSPPPPFFFKVLEDLKQCILSKRPYCTGEELLVVRFPEIAQASSSLLGCCSATRTRRRAPWKVNLANAIAPVGKVVETAGVRSSTNFDRPERIDLLDFLPPLGAAAQKPGGYRKLSYSIIPAAWWIGGSLW